MGTASTAPVGAPGGKEAAVRRRIAAIGIGLLVATAAVAPATAAQAATTTTVHGTVQSGATKLGGVPVGFWTRTGHKLAAATTGAGGAFTLRVPSGVRGFAYAGTRPDAQKAIFALGGKSYVRGVIGTTQGRTTSYRIYQGHASATAANLAGGATLRFKLQKPGRIRVLGGDFFEGAPGTRGIIAVQRLNGSHIQTVVAGRTTGTATSRLLVPGAYRVRAIPQVPYLPRTVSVTVPAGTTRTISPAFSKGAAVTGVVTGPGGAPAVGVQVWVRNGVFRPISDVTDANGRYSLRAFPAGTHRLRVGYAYPRDPEGDLPPVVPPPTDDNYLPRTVPFTVDAAHHAVTKNVTLQKAGHVTGTVTGTKGLETEVWLETEDHRVIRSDAGSGGAYALGGLRPGTKYTVYAVEPGGQADPRYGSASFTATAGTLTRDIAIDTKTLTLSGTLVGGGSLRLRTHGDMVPQRERFSTGNPLESTGPYEVGGLIPGTYDVVRFPGPGNRLFGRDTTLTLTRSTLKDFGQTPKGGTYRVRFMSGSAPVPHVYAEARNGSGDVASISTSYRSNTNRTGRAVADSLWPGTYRYTASSFARGQPEDNVPTVDGPWWFGVSSSTFTITSGRTTDDGTIALHVRARR